MASLQEDTNHHLFNRATASPIHSNPTLVSLQRQPTKMSATNSTTEAVLTASARLFGVVDYILLTVMFVLSTAIGVFYACTGGKQKTTQEFLLADRSMSLLPVAFSLLATFVSATTLLGLTAEIYTFGSQYTFVIVGCSMLFPAVCYLFLPVYYELGVTSVNEYLERRFNRTIRKFAAAIYIIQTVFFLAVVVYSPSLALSHATGFHFWGCVLVIIGICTLYTTIGGIKAVMWTDVLQSIIMITAIFVIMFKGMIDVGGFENVWMTVMKGKRLEFFNYSIDPRVRHTIWTQSIGNFFSTLPTYAVNQAQVQRYLAAHSMKTARRALWGNLVGWIWINVSCAIIGFILYARYHDCDPVSAGIITRNDQLLPHYAMEVFASAPGFPGLFIAGLMSGSLSTLSTGLNSLAAVTFEDFIKAFPCGRVSEKTGTRIVKLLAFSYGVLCLAFMGFVKNFSTVSEAALGILGLLGGPMLGLFVLGMFFPWSNSWGAGIGVLLGLGMSGWIKIGAYVSGIHYPKLPTSIEGCLSNNHTSKIIESKNLTSFLTTTVPTVVQDVFSSSIPLSDSDSSLNVLYAISYMWYGLISCSVVIVSGLLISFATGPRNAKDLDPRLFCPLTKYVMRKIPKKMRTAILCDVAEEQEMDKMHNGQIETLLEKKQISEDVTTC